MKPILFSIEMVQAILEGRKTQTRRVIRLASDIENYIQKTNNDKEIIASLAKYAPYKPGDILWVRETWRCMGFDDEPDKPQALIQYKDETSQWVTMDSYERFKKYALCCALWNPSIFMPREAARIFLEVKSVRVERLQNITEENAYSEGINSECDDYGIAERYEAAGAFHGSPAIYAYGCLWDTLNAKRGYGWDVNPWVWVITFERGER